MKRVTEVCEALEARHGSDVIPLLAAVPMIMALAEVKIRGGAQPEAIIKDLRHATGVAVSVMRQLGATPEDLNSLRQAACGDVDDIASGRQ